jgi:hypothetical protein
VERRVIDPATEPSVRSLIGVEGSAERFAGGPQCIEVMDLGIDRDDVAIRAHRDSSGSFFRLGAFGKALGNRRAVLPLRAKNE